MNQYKDHSVRFTEDYKSLIDSDGNIIKFNDPRVMHIWPYMPNEYVSGMIENVFTKIGWNFRTGVKVSHDSLKYAGKFCSGRECFSLKASFALAYKDVVENRKEDEISIYYTIDQDGPCSIGGFPILWEIFAARLNMKNAVFCGDTGVRTDYLGNNQLAMNLVRAAVVADIFLEAEGVMKCCSDENNLSLFQNECNKVVDSFLYSVNKIDKAFKTWSKNIAKIPLFMNVDEMPKVLIMGGGGVDFVQEAISKFFIDQGIIPKLIDKTEFICHLEMEPAMRFGVKRGRLSPAKQWKLLSVLISVFNKNLKKDVKKALMSNLSLISTDILIKKYRRIAKKSGFIYDDYISFKKNISTGHKYSSYNCYCESTMASGRYINTIKRNVFDGIVHVGSENCQPALNSQAILRPITNVNKMPYVAIDMEGITLSANQYKLLETLAVQAKNLRKKKNALMKK